MIADAGPIGIATLVVHRSLLILLLLQVILVPLHHRVVFSTPLVSVVSEIGMLLGNLDLFLQPLFFIVQFSQSVF